MALSPNQERAEWARTPGTVARWRASRMRRSRPRSVLPITVSPSRTRASPSTVPRASSTRSARGFSLPLTDSTSTSAAVSATASPRMSSIRWPSRGQAVGAEDVVELRLAVPLALGQPLDHQYAGQAEGAAGELPVPGSGHRHRPRRDVPPADLFAGLGVDHRDRRVEDYPGPDHRAAPDPGALGDHGPAADQRLVLDHHRPGVR